MGGEGWGEVGSSYKLRLRFLDLARNPDLNLPATTLEIDSKITSKIKIPCLRSLCFLLLIVFGRTAHAVETFSVLPMKLGAPAPLPASCPWNFSPARVPALPETARGFRGSTREMFFPGILSPAAFAHHIERFNAMEDENVTNFVSNAKSWTWLQENIPLFECPDRDVEETYYFRWWSFRKHLRQTPNGFVITEFLTPVSHAGEFNTISCAAGHHLAEGRWLRDPRYLDDYIRFWLNGNHGKPQPHFHKFSSWFAAAVYDRYLVNGDRKFVVGRLSDLVSDCRLWEQGRRPGKGLFWQYDVRDGMEESIGGSRTNKNLRPTINS